MIRSTPYKILENPLIYNVFQHIVAPGHNLLLKKQFQSIFDFSDGLILDVGCGPLLNTPVPGGRLYGIDVNLNYIKQYTMPQNQEGIVGSADSIPFKNNLFNESRSFGLLHHLPKEKALLTVCEMIRCTKANGRVIILDNVWPRNPYLRPLAWLSRRMDRGQWVRHEEELLNIAEEAYSGQWQLRRFTYTFFGQEAIALIIKKK